MKIGNIVKFIDNKPSAIGICVSETKHDQVGDYAYFYWSDDGEIIIEYLHELEVIA